MKFKILDLSLVLEARLSGAINEMKAIIILKKILVSLYIRVSCYYSLHSATFYHCTGDIWSRNKILLDKFGKKFQI